MTAMKIKLTLQALGLAFILPLIAAITISAVGFGYAVAQYGFVSIGALVTLAAMLGFIAVPVLAFYLFYNKFYSHIDGILDMGDDVTVYVISGGLLNNVGPMAVMNALATCLRRAYRAFQDVGYVVQQIEVKRPIDGLFVIFVADIDEMQYYRKWGIKYKRIAGLNLGDRVLVVKQLMEALDATALEHEIYHSIVSAHNADLRTIGQLATVEDALGLERSI